MGSVGGGETDKHTHARTQLVSCQLVVCCGSSVNLLLHLMIRQTAASGPVTVEVKAHQYLIPSNVWEGKFLIWQMKSVRSFLVVSTSSLSTCRLVCIT